MNLTLLSRVAFALLPLSLAAAEGRASDWIEADVARVRLLEGRSEGAETLRAGLDIELKDGWKTYWRSPGSAGVTPSFDWSGSKNLKSAEVLWPRPQKLESAGSEFWGYDSQVVLPIRVVPEDPSKPVDLDLKIAFGVCQDICTPLDLDLTRRLTGQPAGSEDNRRIAEAETLVPPDGAEIGVSLGEAKLIGEGIRRVFTAELKEAGEFEAPEAIFAGPDSLAFGSVETIREDGKILFKAKVMAFGKGGWTGEPVSITLFEGPFAAEVRGEITAELAAAP